jgi:hypothetical protein
MKKMGLFLLAALIFAHPVCLAGSLDSPAVPADNNGQLTGSSSPADSGVSKEYLAEQKVKMLPSKHGSTIDSYLTNMARIPIAEDLGWKVSAVDDGFEVVRSIMVDNSRVFRYKWKVSDTGEVTPLDDGARSLMK